jgi:hypothetical protein
MIQSPPPRVKTRVGASPCSADLYGRLGTSISQQDCPRETARMISILAATVFSAALTTVKPKRKHHVAPAHDITLAAERIERRRAVRLAIIAALTRREAALEDFLASTATETPLFATHVPTSAGPLTIGATVIGVDFLGSPIIRSTVRNTSSIRTNAVLVAHLMYDGGRGAEASFALSAIGPGESRALEMLCPSSIRPTALRWTIDTF